MNTCVTRTIDLLARDRYPELSDEGKAILINNIVQKTAYKGEIILNEGEVSSDIIFVEHGMLRQFYFKNKKDITEHFSYENSIVMCIESFLQQEPTKLMIEALEPTVYYTLSYSKLKTLVEIYPEIDRFYRGILEFSLIVSQKKADSWRFESAKERYNRLFNEHPEIIKRASLSHIASYLLMTPETLSRVRSNL